MKSFVLQSMSINQITIGLFLSAAFILLPQLTFAATASIMTDNKTVSVGDTAIVSFVLDTDGRKPNTVEGEVEISSGAKNITISGFSQAGSALSFWPKTPSLDSPTKVSFIGGTPGGFKGGKELLFKIIFTATAEGQVVFSPANIKVYDNDGKATIIETTNKPLTLNIGPKGAQSQNEWSDIISADHQAPHDITVTFGQNSSVYNGQKFMTISAIDDESGINYYEVIEGDRPAVRSGSTYVLIDQREKTVLTVIAYDKAGNSSKILVTPTDTKPSNLWQNLSVGIIALLIISVVVWFVRILRKRRRKVGFH